MQYIYTKEKLKQLHQIELKIVTEFAEICEKNDIDYFLCGGSAIGVLRHGGFIPWDDDIDVGMSRKDYDKFLAIAKAQYSDRYTVVNNQENPNFFLMNTRWGLNGTQFIPEDFKKVKGNFGIFLDIFCFDNIPDDEKEMRKQGTWAWFWGKLLVLSGVSRPVLYVGGVKAKVVLFISFFVHWFFKIVYLKPRLFYNKASKQMLKYKDVETKRMAYMFDPQRFTSIVNKADIYPTQKRKFENIEVRVPNKVEEYLTTRYGNYMELPPEDKRHNHPPHILDFGEFKDNNL